MMLPDIPDIRASLAELVLTPIANEDVKPDAVLVAPKTRRQFVDGRRDEHPTAIMLHQRRAAPISVRRLTEKIADSLARNGHSHCQKTSPARIDIAGRLLALAVLTRPSSNQLLEEVNAHIGALTSVDLRLWSVLAAPATNRALDHFGDFYYGIMDIDELHRLCKHAGSDYAVLYAQELKGRRALMRTGTTVKMVDFKALLPEKLTKAAANYQYRLTDEYYSAIADQERRRFLVDLDRQQAVDGTAGLGTIPADTLLRMEAATTWIAVFTREQALHGWVVPIQIYFQLTTVEPSAYAAGRKSIREDLGLEDWSKRPLDEDLQRYCEYFTSAQTLAASGRLEEALLHFVFGLDLLLGGDANQALTETLSQRTAVLTHRALASPFSAIESFIRDCYEMRSGYAHRGHRGLLGEETKGFSLDGRVDRLECIGRVVFGAALIARREPWAQTKDARTTWLSRVDILRAKLKAGIPLDTADEESLGLTRILLSEGKLPALTIKVQRAVG